MTRLTASQQSAVAAKGNVLVMAGAGSGKTSTMVARCLNRVLDSPDRVPLDRILMVTFTDAAAAEMRERIRHELQERSSRFPEDPWLHEQLSLLETAHIRTLHSFCFQLIRRHFNAVELKLDPQVSVLPDEEAALIALETMENLFSAHYAGSAPVDLAVQSLVADVARGDESLIRDRILQLHAYAHTRPDAAQWLSVQRAHHGASDAGGWHSLYRHGSFERFSFWLPHLESLANNPNAAAAAAAIREFLALGRADSYRFPEHLETLFEKIQQVRTEWPKGKKTILIRPLDTFLREMAFFESLLPSNGSDPLAEDWNWSRERALTLLDLAVEFETRFSEAKHNLAGVDYHDLEQFALRLLWDAGRGQPTALATEWRERFDFVFVDEYQDLNTAQDLILRALSREGAAANRFLVGDVKQSIYRFRLAEPRIFQQYAGEWHGKESPGECLRLSENFRSHEAILGFINAFFAATMRPEIGGVVYDSEAFLRFGDPGGRAPLSVDPSPRVEMHLRVTGEKPSDQDDDTDAETAAPDPAEIRTEVEREARLIGRRLIELVGSGFQVRDAASGDSRPVRWSDIVILLRGVKSRAEGYAREFHRLNVPLEARSGGFFDSTEVTDILNLLEILDNPLQDVPLLAVLRSPIVGLSVNDLATIRQAAPRVHFWTALNAWAKHAPSNDAAVEARVGRFLELFSHWRRLAPQTSLYQQIETILRETHYLDWLATQSQPVRRLQNVRQLLAAARRFDHFQQQGLNRFLDLVRAWRDEEMTPDVPSGAGENAVRLMSIHQSKGLEFPVVIVASLGARFRLDHRGSAILLDDQYGLCSTVKPPGFGRHYPSLPLWLARKKLDADVLGEEARLFYVAMTRARDLLVLSGSVSAKIAMENWPAAAASAPSTHDLLRAPGFLGWLGPWLTRHLGDPQWTQKENGESAGVRWTIHRDADDADADAASAGDSNPAGVPPPLSAEAAVDLRRRVDWEYPHRPAAAMRAKEQVSALARRQWVHDEEGSTRLFSTTKGRRRKSSATRVPGALSAGDTGTAHHLFLQRVPLAKTGSPAELRAEADRMRDAGILDEEQCKVLNFDALNAFWQSPLGQQLRGVGEPAVHREMPFTARVSPSDLRRLNLLAPAVSLDPEEFVVIQGVVDLALIQPGEITLLDFKTDEFPESELPLKIQHYTPQLQLYALALEGIYRRPVRNLWLYFLRHFKLSPVPWPLADI